MNPQKLNKTLLLVGQLLVSEMYNELEQLTNGQNLTAEELRQAVTEYGRRITHPPESDWKTSSIVEVEESNPQAWSVYLDIWTLEEGRSDLTLELTLEDCDADIYRIILDNLHVL